MKKTIIVVWLLLLAYSHISAMSETIQVTALPDGSEYISNKFVAIKKYNVPSFLTDNFDSGYPVTGAGSVDSLCRNLGVVRVEKFYKWKLSKPALKREVSRIYIFTLKQGISPLAVIQAFTNDPSIELAELYNVPSLCYDPNDPLAYEQWHLAHTHTLEAWDTIRGDTTRHSIIGIIDSGINYEHIDLASNIWVNEIEDLNHNGTLDPEDINNIDDDDNGFVDDVIGWDFADNDNDPMEDLLHGSGVAGCASEVTDNGIFGAGIGFSARLMCLKAINVQGQLIDGYQPMIYAAENGAQILNCSWGTLNFSQAEQNIIDAVWEEDVLIIASAGGFHNQQEMYPAAYDHVMAVAATDQYDH